MSLSAAVIRELVNAGLSGEALVSACERIEASSPPVRHIDEQAERRRERDRERKRAERLRNSAESADTPPSPPFPDKEKSPTPPKEINPYPPLPPHASPARARDFAAFWAEYPNKTGKRAAETAFVRASKRTDLETLMAGLRRYVAKTDDRPWCNPATWLNQDRWEDAPASVTPNRLANAPPKVTRTVSQAAQDSLTEKYCNGELTDDDFIAFGLPVPTRDGNSNRDGLDRPRFNALP